MVIPAAQMGQYQAKEPSLWTVGGVTSGDAAHDVPVRQRAVHDGVLPDLFEGVSILNRPVRQ